MLPEFIAAIGIVSAFYSIVSMKQFGQARPLSQHLKFSNALLIRFRRFCRYFHLHSRTGSEIHRTVSLRSLAPWFGGNAPDC
jgi:hypothetical protein